MVDIFLKIGILIFKNSLKIYHVKAQNFNIDKKIFELIKNIQIKVKNIKLNINIGTIDAVLTSYLVDIIDSIIGIILPHITEKNNINTCYFIVNPKYQNKNEYNIKFEGIIYIKIVHIIFSMLNFVRKGSNENERTSNRGTYAYSNEWYRSKRNLFYCK